jgi:protein involved in polysaccharide export with SLBB domain
MHLSDLIPDRDSLLSRDYWWKRSRLGLPGPEFEPYLSSFEANQERLLRNQASAAGRPAPNVDRDPASVTAQSALTDAQTASEPKDVFETENDPETSRQTGGSGTLASHYQQMNAPGASASSRTKRTDVFLSTPEIDWNYAVIERLDRQTLKTSLISFNLGKLVLNHDASQDLALQPDDTVTVFSQADIKVPLEEQTKYVRLEGEFVNAGVYSVQKDETLRDLVRRAGGVTGRAYLYGSEFDRESTRVLQQQRIDEYVRRVDLDAGRGTLALTSSATSSQGTVANAAASTAAEQELLARLKQIRATGRVVLSFEPKSASIDDIPAISLENGDKFTIPPVPATINIVGAVYDQNSFLYHDHNLAGRYIQMAGGPDRDADWRHTFVIRADGSVVSREAVKGVWGNTFNELSLNPGDTIIVPDKTLRPTALRGLLDWTQIFSQLAIGAAAVEVLRQ